jgi:hypothetical protein
MRFLLVLVVIALMAFPRGPAAGTDDPLTEANSLDQQAHRLFGEGRYKDDAEAEPLRWSEKLAADHIKRIFLQP